MAFTYQEPIEIISIERVESAIPGVLKEKENCRIILEKKTWIGLVTTLKQTGLHCTIRFATLPRLHGVFLSQRSAHSLGNRLISLDENLFDDSNKPFIREYQRIGDLFRRSQIIVIKNRNDHFNREY